MTSVLVLLLTAAANMLYMPVNKMFISSPVHEEDCSLWYFLYASVPLAPLNTELSHKYNTTFWIHVRTISTLLLSLCKSGISTLTSSGIALPKKVLFISLGNCVLSTSFFPKDLPELDIASKSTDQFGSRKN